MIELLLFLFGILAGAAGALGLARRYRARDGFLGTAIRFLIADQNKEI